MKKSSGWPLIALASVVLLVAIAQRALVSVRPEPPHEPLPLPPLMASGWLNTEAPPTLESLAGKWVVLDVWALSCPACIADAPNLVRLHRAIASRGDVVLIGLNEDTEQDRDRLEAYLDRVSGYDWPVAYGATPTSDLLGVRQWPTLVLFDPSGQSVWRGHFVEQLAEQLKNRLGVDAAPLD